jgi:hypothetical protein
MTQFYPIRMVRLMTGETLIAGIGKSGKNSYILEKPMVMALVSVQSQQKDSPPLQEVNVVLKNWIDFAAEDYIVVKKEVVMCIVRPIQGIISDYTQARINSDIIEDMGSMGPVDALRDDMDDGSDQDTMDPNEDGADGREGKNGYDEFPGWGGDPRM